MEEKNVKSLAAVRSNSEALVKAKTENSKNLFRFSGIQKFVSNLLPFRKTLHSSVPNVSSSNEENEDCVIDTSGDFRSEECKESSLSHKENKIRTDTVMFVQNRKSKLSLDNLRMEEENKDSTIHMDFADDFGDYEPEDDDYFISPRKSIEDKYSKRATNFQTYQQPSNDFSDTSKEFPNDEEEEEYELFEPDESSSYEFAERYIDSGLRRLKSEESRLILDSAIYKNKKKPPPAEDVKPVLKELPSEIFRPPRVRTKHRGEGEPQILEEVQEGGSTQTTSTQEEEEIESSVRSDEDTDREPLKKLKEHEDKTFRISTRKLIDEDIQDILPPRKVTSSDEHILPPVLVPVMPPKPKPPKKVEEVKKADEDFCVHTKDAPDVFSTEVLPTNKAKKKRKYNFLCIHSEEGDENDAYSLSISRENEERENSNISTGTAYRQRLRKRQHSDSSRSSKATNRSSKGQGFSAVSIIDNKEKRKSKHTSRMSSKN